MSPVDLERIKKTGMYHDSDVFTLVAEVEALRATVRRCEWQASFQSLYQETDMRLKQTQADLAAARAALELARQIISDMVARFPGYDPRVNQVDDMIMRLGTGEALAAVREAQRALVFYAGRYGDPEHGSLAEDGLARLRAVFGEKP